MNDRGYVALVLAAGCGALAVVAFSLTGPPALSGYSYAWLTGKALTVAAVVFGAYGAYAVGTVVIDRRTSDRVERHKLASVLQLSFAVLGAAAVLGVLTDRWVPALVSLGVAGFAVTFALQQPLLSLFGWAYVMLADPYQVGDRVDVGGAKGDVVDVGLLVTTLWEIDGELVASNQPSGRHITVPNSVVLSATVTNFTREEFPYVWNEIEVQVVYETDLDFASDLMCEAADDVLGEEMARAIRRYRDLLAETPVDLDVSERPSVNVVAEGSFVTLRLRYLVDPKRGQRTKNELYRRILERFNDHPDRVAFPVSRNR